jgi:TRAP-type C4-dicarboxylate transport system permease small subunit
MAENADLAAIESAAAQARFDPLRLVLDLMAAIGTIWTFLIMLLIVGDVVGRSFLSMPITGVAEIAAHSIVAIVFLQLGSAVYARRMTRADFLIDIIQNRSWRLARIIEIAFALFAAATMAFIGMASWKPFMNAFNGAEFFGVPGLFTIPTWPLRGIVVAGSVAATVAFLALAAIETRQLVTGRAR